MLLNVIIWLAVFLYKIQKNKIMKAAVVVGYNDIQYIEHPEPKVNSGDVKVAVKYCGICGSDIPRVLNGTCHSFPQILGHEFSGIITEIGNQVSSVAVGDHVVGIPLVPCMECEDCKNGNYSLCKHYSFIGSRQQGGMAEYVVVPESNVFKIDSSIRMDYAALFEPSTVALHGILINDFKPTDDEYVCVIGSGVIALFTIQWCKILGAKKVIVIGRSKKGLDIACNYGADAVISTLDSDCIEKVMKKTNYKGFKYVLDAAGTRDTIHTSLQIAANKAKICFIGTPTKPIDFTVKMWELINRKEVHITGSWMSYSAPWPGKEWEKTAEHMASGKLKINDDMIYCHYPISKVKEAFELFEINHSSIKGRIMLDIQK